MDRRDALVEPFMARLEGRAPHEPEFTQAVEDVARDVLTVEKAHSDWAAARVLERLTVPDRMIEFRVEWRDDAGEVRINRGWRVQMSQALGPYKGGIRFTSDLTPSVLKFLAFEQSFKNALTGLPLGGAKGGADFDPRGCSGPEIERFCSAYMTELARHIGPDRDVPAGDINVGAREIGYLYGRYLRQQGRWHGALTGKGLDFGGSALRVEATGYGLVHFVCHMLAAVGDSLPGKRVAISGMGNVALHAAEKAIAEGARVLALSDSSGVLVSEDGISTDALAWVRETKGACKDISDPPRRLGLEFREGKRPWDLACDIALPCATQNELGDADARALVDGPCQLLAEGANMPLTPEARKRIGRAQILYAPGKAANAGGVAVSGIEMSQNAHGQYLGKSEVETKLRKIMGGLHDSLQAEATAQTGPGGRIDYARAANLAAYRRLAGALTALGV